MKRLAVLLLCLFTVSIAVAGGSYTVEFRNETDHTVLYYLYRLDHPDFRGPVNYAGGELGPGDSITTRPYPEGIYGVRWIDKVDGVDDAYTFKLMIDMAFVWSGAGK